jgi:hypothetical protein
MDVSRHPAVPTGTILRDQRLPVSGDCLDRAWSGGWTSEVVYREQSTTIPLIRTQSYPCIRTRRRPPSTRHDGRYRSELHHGSCRDSDDVCRVCRQDHQPTWFRSFGGSVGAVGYECYKARRCACTRRGNRRSRAIYQVPQRAAGKRRGWKLASRLIQILTDRPEVAGAWKTYR